ncbi:hypothetical protein BRD07_08390 [Halobacteriales archaeon QS_9_68_42]|nr:MAG: hypothetical protein BRC84_04650 [Halobacteriales archaeon QS_1_68_44]PSQ39712.1 MAG: hypothetical protein BRD07_08390 [Halobacteriales archaeon QS_9_68_42]
MRRRWYLASLFGGGLAGCTGDDAPETTDSTETPGGTVRETLTEAPTKTPTETPTETQTATREPTPVPPSSDAARLNMPFTEPWEAPNDDEVTLTATTNVEPDTDFTAKIDHRGEINDNASPVFQRDTETVSEDGRLSWDFNFSGNEEGRKFKLTIRVRSDQSWEYDGVIVSDDG